ncbi:hypothetical protein [Halopelagius longus]|uniref:Uncharacterized protein n=1 Tax=Halopelagius longus TaxID=1236180 RepID=A0A1H1FYS0_9EURY|nr:hypothetical protein [Halopelagius longus]RDI69945.1 hypothetical protein DWB78_17520 [Halopelagius longus]SDR06144.1 hypothetical protein SAMN05216278_3409 [Halopelagius longus]
MEFVGIVAVATILGVSGYNVRTAYGSRSWANLAVHILGLFAASLGAVEFFGLRVPLGVAPASGIKIIALLMALILLANYLLQRFAPRARRSSG